MIHKIRELQFLLFSITALTYGCVKANDISLNDYLLINLDFESLDNNKVNKQVYYDGTEFSFDITTLCYSSVILKSVWKGKISDYPIWRKKEVRQEKLYLSRGINPHSLTNSHIIEIAPENYGYSYINLRGDQTGEYVFEVLFVFYYDEFQYAVTLGAIDDFLKNHIIADANMEFFSKRPYSDVWDYDPDCWGSKKEYLEKEIYEIEDEKGFIQKILLNQAGPASDLFSEFHTVFKSVRIKDR